MNHMEGTSEPSYHRFPPTFWARAGYSQAALPVNRLGRLADDQVTFMLGDGFRVGCYLFAALGGAFGIVILLSQARFDAGRVLAMLGLLALTAIFVFFAFDIVRKFNRDQRSRRLSSFCGELTRWIDVNSEGFTDDFHGLEHGTLRVNISLSAFNALPQVGHYRIYFTHHQRNVVNVEEHTEDASHVWPTVDTAPGSPDSR